MRSILLVFALFLLAFAHAAPTKTINPERRSDRLSNAQRLARGLPIQHPKRLFDASVTHGASTHLANNAPILMCSTLTPDFLLNCPISCSC
ncbi:hypothetical protein IAT38_002060 [Cryptococcus sp. DSM 104549]